ncbi:MAG: hypothetical protein M1823_000711 [Watsoniomyces obsoletus]|nr:MAG: hypothetical protein M1823_000711 [Watsoniomyces obsoletus]
MDTLAERNRHHFDEQAANYDQDPSHKVLAARLALEISKRREWIAAGLLLNPDSDEDESDEDKSTNTRTRSIKVLDYGCGTGQLSRAFAPFATKIRGIDISAKMVERYNESANHQGLYPDEMSAVVGDLFDPTGPPPCIPGPEYFEFDLAVVGLGLHHFEDPQLAIKRLVERVKLGTGVLLIIDFSPHGFISGEAAERTVAHQGFGEIEMMNMMKQAGCEDVRSVVLGKGVTVGHDGVKKYERSVFMCRGTRRDETRINDDDGSVEGYPSSL